MRPHMTQRVNKDNELTYYYSCNLKLRSKKSRCDGKNANGNEIDKKVIEAIKALDLDGEDYFVSLKKTLSQNGIEKNDSESEAVKLQEEIEQAEKDIQKLVDSLTGSGGAEKYILQRIDELGNKANNYKARLETLQSDNRELFDRINAVDLMRDLIKHFANNVDSLSIEQKRLAIRAFVKEVIIFCRNYKYNEHYLNEYPGYVKKIFTSIESLYEYLKKFDICEFVEGISNYFSFEQIQTNKQLELCPLITAKEYDKCYFLIHKAYSYFFDDMNNNDYYSNSKRFSDIYQTKILDYLFETITGGKEKMKIFIFLNL